jgi:hypothetical protein
VAPLIRQAIEHDGVLDGRRPAAPDDAEAPDLQPRQQPLVRVRFRTLRRCRRA